VPTVDVNDAELVVHLTPLEKIGAFHGDLRLPRASVRSAEVVAQPFTRLRGLRAPGTAIPGVIALGTWRRRGGEKNFAAVYRRRPVLVVELDAEQAGYRRLFLSIDSPEEVAALFSST
jgi:hypothetical protein